MTSDRFLSIRARECVDATLDENGLVRFSTYDLLHSMILVVYAEAQPQVRKTRTTKFRPDDPSTVKAIGHERIMGQLFSDFRETNFGNSFMDAVVKSGTIGYIFGMKGKKGLKEIHPYTYKGDLDNLIKGTQDHLFYMDKHRNDRSIYRYLTTEAYGIPAEMGPPRIIIGTIKNEKADREYLTEKMRHALIL